ncbi:MAG: ThuA domain-containing protein [Bryobacterales bacterium]|nr:ThuA domain-containing protein [Bryobacterales bacterium]
MKRLLLALLIVATPLAAQPAKLRALIYSGRNNHDWRTTTPFLKKILLDTGRFDVRVNEEPAGNSAATLAPYDVLVLDYCGARWGETAEKAVERFVASGKGLVVFHAASYPFGDAPILGDNMTNTGKFEPPWMEYRKMVGAFWSKAEKPITGHGQRHSFKVKWTRPDHPVACGLEESFWATDELYHGFRMMPGVEVLATAFDDAKFGGTGKDEPILWTVRYGQGRVFQHALGHNVAALQEAGFRASFARGAEWAATGSVSPPASGKPKTRLLVVTGGHTYDTTFYTLFDHPDLAWDHATSNRAAFKKDVRDNYDTVLLYNMEQELNEAERKNFQDFVEAGKGVVTLHHAAANYNAWPWWYEQISGVKYFLKPEGGRPGSTYRHDIELFVTPAAKHPVAGDIGPMHLTDEGYKGMWISPKAQILFTTDHPDADKPSVWTMPHEKARLVTILLGHDKLAHANDGFRKLVKNAIDWTAGK